MTREEKQQAVHILGRRLKEQRNDVDCIDHRLLTYFEDIINDEDAHNGNEVLCAVKFLRLLRTYGFNHRLVRQVIKLREGTWHQLPNGVWQHERGGLKQPLTSGDMVLRWEPFQIATLAYIFGPQTWIDTELTLEDRSTLLPTERLNEQTGHIEDLRRLCTNFTLFGPRKIDKTGIAAFLAQVFFLLADNNSETYCCSNSSDQSKILYRRIRHGLQQLDPEGQKIRMTETVCDWRPAFQSIRNSSIRPLSAGGKTKDGMFAQLCCADEYGSAAYTNGKCDMKRLVDVTESSMGPRREPLTIITTTAGRITSGPFIEKLESLHRLLLEELKYDTGEAIPQLSLDRIGCIMFEPDDWEKTDDEMLLSSKAVRRKINPMLGKIVQHSFYDDEVAKARMDGDMGEVISKLFNVYSSGKAKNWVVTADKVRALQTARRVTDCKYADGWNVFVGLDFSSGEDLFAISYFCVNYTAGMEMQDRFFADCEAWIVEAELLRSPNRPLYELWIKAGWLHVCPGEVFDSNYAINELIRKSESGVNLAMFGYDPAQSKQPINTLKAWLSTLGIDADTVRAMVVPVSQSFMTMNPIISELEDYVLMPWMWMSESPLWPWMAGNVAVVYSRDDTLRRLQKSGVNNKIDCLHALLDAIYVFDMSESRLQQ